MDANAKRIVIVGAGATGVELSAELIHAAADNARYGLDEIQPEGVKISLMIVGQQMHPYLLLYHVRRFAA